MLTDADFEFTATAIGTSVKKLDIVVLATLVQGELLCDEQNDAVKEIEPQLEVLERDSVLLHELMEIVSTVLQAKPADNGVHHYHSVDIQIM